MAWLSKHAENVIKLRETFEERYSRYNPIPNFILGTREQCFLTQKELNRRGLLFG